MSSATWRSGTPAITSLEANVCRKVPREILNAGRLDGLVQEFPRVGLLEDIRRVDNPRQRAEDFADHRVHRYRVSLPRLGARQPDDAGAEVDVRPAQASVLYLRGSELVTAAHPSVQGHQDGRLPLWPRFPDDPEQVGLLMV